MKTLLIHNDNVAQKEHYTHSKKFSVVSSDIDAYISSDIIVSMQKIEYDIVYIKDNLSDNYIDLLGLRVAYHIRLSQELGDKRYLPIVILSDVDTDILNRLDPLARILFTKNIYTIANEVASVKKFQATYSPKPMSALEYQQDFLPHIHLISSEKDTSHSIANEWAIYGWAEFLKVDSDAIEKNREKIASMLYFKYLLAQNPVKVSNEDTTVQIPKNSGKVLLIDDEWKSGWSDIVSNILASNKSIEFKPFDYNFQDKPFGKLFYHILKKKLEEFDPDVVVLDLRLAQTDHESDDVESYVGIKILEEIHKINAGIQVIMLTATGRSIILEKLYEKKILGYIKKEHPEDKNIQTKENINKLSTLIDEGLERKYLKEIWTISQALLKLQVLENKDLQPIQFEINALFEILDSNMHKRYTYAMLSIFQALEIINNYYINDSTKKWKDGYDGEIEVEGNGYTKQKIEAVLKRLELYDDYQDEIDTIARMRKNVIHPPKHTREESPTKENIVTWYTMLQTILEKIEKTKGATK